MTRIDVPENCSNSPRSALVCELLAARTVQDIDLLERWCTEETEWDIVGYRSFVGLDDIVGATPALFAQPATALTIDNVLSHGKLVAATGAFEFETGDKWRFSEVFEFSGHSKVAKLRLMSSYWIDLADLSAG